MKRVATLALVGEDTAHAVLLAALTRASIAEAARAVGRDWVVDNLAHDPALDGDDDLTAVLPGLRYTNSIRGLGAPESSLHIGGRPVKLRGHLGGHALAPEAQKWRYLLVGLLSRAPDAVLVAKDTDGDPASLDGLRQVAAHLETLDPRHVIVIAAPHQDAECWLVAGCAGKVAHEVAEATRRALRFDPVQHPERLTAHPNDAATDAKRVLRALLGLEVKSAPLDRDETAAHAEALLRDLDALREPRCAATGLVGFLDAVRARVVPLVVPGV
ncbi:MAG: hypothetical protein U0324_04650 [Polyangiales bacterium]